MRTEPRFPFDCSASATSVIGWLRRRVGDQLCVTLESGDRAILDHGAMPLPASIYPGSSGVRVMPDPTPVDTVGVCPAMLTTWRHNPQRLLMEAASLAARGFSPIGGRWSAQSSGRLISSLPLLRLRFHTYKQSFRRRFGHRQQSRRRLRLARQRLLIKIPHLPPPRETRLKLLGTNNLFLHSSRRNE